MAGDESEQKTPFKVQDRRRFSATGDAREDVAEPDVAPGRRDADTATGTPPPSATADAAKAEHGPAAPAEVTFASFVFSLSTQALVHLGEIPDPADGTTQIHLDAAQQIIDLLAMLGVKTRGNLDDAESALLDNALYDLRMRYVDRVRRR